MMDDTKLFTGPPVDPGRARRRGAGRGRRRRRRPADAGAVPRPATVSAAVEKFRSCRWRAIPEDGEFCTHRDVLPFAGKEGFVAESWCPDCAFYKLRRTPKKRERLDFTY